MPETCAIDDADNKITLNLVGNFCGNTRTTHPGHAYRARFVRAGRVKASDGTQANIVIEPAALENSVHLFNNRAVFLDHAGFFNYPSLEKLAGVTVNPFYKPGEQSIEGEIQLAKTPTGELARAIIDDLLSNPQTAPDIGLSMVCYAKFAPGEGDNQPRRMTGITHVESVDLVFQPAADGRILQALSTHFVPFGDQTMTDKLIPNLQDPPAPEPSPQQQISVAAWQDAFAETISAAIIAGSGLPEPSRQRLSVQTWSDPAALKSAIDAERAYLAALSQDSVIQIGGIPPRSPHISGMLDSLDKIQLALDALFAGSSPPSGVQPLTGIRELYHLLSGDYEMTGVFHHDRIQYANANSSTMASMVANALNKVVAQEFIEYPQWWRPIVVSMDFDSLQTVKWITLGGVGDLPTVAEGAAYTELTWDDKYESSTFVKKGGYLGITMEAIDKDETGRLRSAPRALAQSAWLTLSKSISGIFTSNAGAGPTLSDSQALFAAGRGNVGSSALSVGTWGAARMAMRKFTELHSGERMGALCAPKFLLVPPDLEITALQILASEYDYSYAVANAPAAPANVHTAGYDLQTRMNFARQRVIVVDLWTDANDWAAVADPRLYPTIGVGFRYGRSPEVFSVASPTAGLMFTNDTMPIKVRFVYAVGPIDWRGLYKANVA